MDEKSNPSEITIRLTPQAPPEITSRAESGLSHSWFARLDDLVDAFRAQHKPALRLLPGDLVASNLETCSVWLCPGGVFALLLAQPERTSLLAVPLPPLLLSAKSNGALAVMALAGDARSKPDTPLYHAPLPNINERGAVCLGSTRLPCFDPLVGAAAWEAFWGSAFSSHQVSGKSKRHPDDVRLLLLELDGRKRFPLDDLLAAGLTMAEWLAELGGFS
jgi:PRTRC genetic system protein B